MVHEIPLEVGSSTLATVHEPWQVRLFLQKLCRTDQPLDFDISA